MLQYIGGGIGLNKLAWPFFFLPTLRLRWCQECSRTVQLGGDKCKTSTAHLPHLLTRSVGSNNWLTPPDPHEDIPIYGLHCASEGLKTTLGPDSLVFRGYSYRLAACLLGLGVGAVMHLSRVSGPGGSLSLTYLFQSCEATCASCLQSST